jgi:uncharacterized protein
VTYLLDVNVLLAILDPGHVAHDSAQTWFQTTQPDWATCPITQNGALRILSGSTYRSVGGAPRFTPAEVVASLSHMVTVRGHVFWADDLSLLDSDLVDASAITSSQQVTDTYLLALAVSKNAKLATFDRRLSPRAVRNGAQALVQLGA